MLDPIVEAVARRPSPSLEPYIDRYIAYRLEGFPAGIHRGLPSRHMTFIISLADPIVVEAMPGAASATGSFGGVVSGLHGGPAIIRHNGTQVGIAIETTPLGARALFGVPAGELASTVLEPADLLGKRVRSLTDQLVESPSWDSRFDVLDRVLSRSLGRSRSPAPEVAWVWNELTATGGSVQVASLAERVGWSRRHLSERFRAEVGVPPKLAARILRFDRARRALSSRGRRNLADVAHATGYFDQAHFTREFTKFAGCSPTCWIKEEFPSVQDEIGVDAAS